MQDLCPALKGTWHKGFLDNPMGHYWLYTWDSQDSPGFLLLSTAFWNSRLNFIFVNVLSPCHLQFLQCLYNDMHSDQQGSFVYQLSKHHTEVAIVRNI